MRAIYCLHPGNVVSRTDGDIHFISVQELARLYGVSLRESVIWKPILEPYKEQYIHLYPREDGNYDFIRKIAKPSVVTEEVKYDVFNNQFGFRWGEVLVERVASNGKKPKFQVIRVFAPNGTGVDIIMTPRTLRIEKFGKEKK